MIRNYLKTAVRSLLRGRTHSLVNIAGLSFGMAVALLIGLWIWNELIFNQSIPDYPRVAQVIQNVNNNGAIQTWMTVPYPLAAELRNKYGSNFRKVVLSSGTGSHLLSYGNKQLDLRGSFFEPGGPGLLGLRMLQGDRSALKDPGSILLSRSVATAIFGSADPVGKPLRIDQEMLGRVAGVYQDLPSNSSFAGLGFIAPWDLYFAHTEWIRTIAEPWRPNAFQIYVQISAGVTMDQVSERIRNAKLIKVSSQMARSKPALFLFPLSRWHLYSDFKDGVNTGGEIRYVWMFGIIGIFVLLMACINFMNLSTARSEKRAREVGIRKALGSLRGQLIGQFFGESFLTVLISFFFSLVLVRLFLPFFNEVAGKEITIPLGSSRFWVCSGGFILITALLAGSYPALYLSSFRSVKALKGSFRVGRWASIPRKVLVVLQFSVSVVMITGTIIVFGQIRYAKNRPIGYNDKGLVEAPLITGGIHAHFNAVCDMLLKSGAISSMAESDGSPTQVWSTTSGIEWTGKDPNLALDFGNLGVSWDFGRTVGWHFLEGRDFSRNFLTDSSALILNASAVRFMGLKDPLNVTLKWFGQPFRVIGVIQDMVMGSPYEEVMPMAFFLDSGKGDYAILRINPRSGAQAAISQIAAAFRLFNPSQPFEFQFVDQDFGKKFDSEERIGNLASFFAILAILISCLGIFGLASFMAEQRTREIGVRKVLGASVMDCWELLSRDFVGLSLISLVIASPVAWALLNRWLRAYPYHEKISGWIFILTGIGLVALTLATVSFQSLSAAIKKPVSSLRTE